MKTYVTKNEAKALKKNLKDQFKAIFCTKEKEELPKQLQHALNTYYATEAVDFLDTDVSKLPQETLKRVATAKRMMEGDKLDYENETHALNVLAEAYGKHKSHIKPSYFHPFKRYAYYLEGKAIKEYEAMLVKKGISQETIDNFAEAAKKDGNYVVNTFNQVTKAGKVRIFMNTDDHDLAMAQQKPGECEVFIKDPLHQNDAPELNVA